MYVALFGVSLSWWIKTFDNIKMHGMYVKKYNVSVYWELGIEYWNI